MQKQGPQPDTFVLNSMLDLYGRLGQFDKMEQVIVAMENRSSKVHISTYNILINAYGRAGFFEKMEDLFLSIPTKKLEARCCNLDISTWCLLEEETIQEMSRNL